ncbi:MAG: rod-binding protein [Tepidisphaeraceae bacterium]|jgi:Rod binding domain-containing protein
MDFTTQHVTPLAHPNTAFTRSPVRVVPEPSQHDKLVTQASKWVAMSFFGPMLKELRQDPFRSKMFDGGEGGQVFGEMYDQELTQRLSGAVGSKLVNSLVRKIEAKQAYAKQDLSKKPSDVQTLRRLTTMTTQPQMPYVTPTH